MSGVDRLFEPGRLKGRWEHARVTPDAPQTEAVDPEKDTLPELLAELKREIESGWQGDNAEVLLLMHGRLVSMATEEETPERNAAMGEVLDTLEALMEAYGIST